MSKHNLNKTVSKKYISKYSLDFMVKDFLNRTKKYKSDKFDCIKISTFVHQMTVKKMKR